mmetsp:Transcript_71282/g.113351  ORF Transcript_71282/g.113351 Transcript_71282/m.113351 type:complete len:401 (-) Transcript_71282:16-1218(-)
MHNQTNKSWCCLAPHQPSLFHFFLFLFLRFFIRRLFLFRKKFQNRLLFLLLIAFRLALIFVFLPLLRSFLLDLFHFLVNLWLILFIPILDRFERFAMNITRTMLPNQLFVKRSRISFILRKLINGILGIVLNHQPIPRHLRNDGRCSDTVDLRISANDILVFQPRRIHKQRIAISVTQHIIHSIRNHILSLFLFFFFILFRQWLLRSLCFHGIMQFDHTFPHSHHRRLQNVVLVDHLVVKHSDCVLDAFVVCDEFVQLLAFVLIVDLLGIGDTFDIHIDRNVGCRDYHRTGQGTTSCLVAANHASISLSEQFAMFALEFIHIFHLIARCLLVLALELVVAFAFGGFTRFALLFPASLRFRCGFGFRFVFWLWFGLGVEIVGVADFVLFVCLLFGFVAVIA